MTRLHLLPQHNLVAQVKAVQRAYNGVKSGAPQALGSTSFRTHLIQSQNAYDIEATGVTFNNTTVLVTFTPDDATTGDGSLVYRFLMAYSDSTGTTYPAGTRYDFVQRQKPANGIQQWYVYIPGDVTATWSWVKLKFYFFASGDGNFTAALV